MPCMGAMPGLPAVPPMPLPPLPPGVPGVGMSPPLVHSVTQQVPSLPNGAPAMIQPISGFSHSGRPNTCLYFRPFGLLIFHKTDYECFSASLSCHTQQNLFVQPFQHQATEGPVCGGTQVNKRSIPSTFTDTWEKLMYIHLSFSLISAPAEPTDWAVSHSSRLKYRQLFNSHDKMMSGYLTGIASITQTVYSPEAAHLQETQYTCPCRTR